MEPFIEIIENPYNMRIQPNDKPMLTCNMEITSLGTKEITDPKSE